MGLDNCPVNVSQILTWDMAVQILPFLKLFHVYKIKNTIISPNDKNEGFFQSTRNKIGKFARNS